jgi:hypothetical protein
MAELTPDKIDALEREGLPIIARPQLDTWCRSRCHEAADEIERLRAVASWRGNRTRRSTARRIRPW